MRKWYWICSIVFWGNLSSGIMGAQLLLSPPLEINIDSESLQPVPIAGSQEAQPQTPDFEASPAPNNSAASETMVGKIRTDNTTAQTTAQTATPPVFPIAAANAAPVVLPASEQQKPLLPFMGPRLEKFEPDPAFRPETFEPQNFRQKLPVPAAQSSSVPKPIAPSSTAKSQATSYRPAASSTQVSSNPLRNSQIRAGAEAKTPLQTHPTGPTAKKQLFTTAAGAEINADMLLIRTDQNPVSRPTNVTPLESLPVITEVEVPLSTLPYPVLEKVNEAKQTGQKTANGNNTEQKISGETRSLPQPALTGNPFLKERPAASEIQATSEIPVTSSEKETVRKTAAASTQTPSTQTPLFQAPVKQESFSLPRQISAPEPETPQVALPDQRANQNAPKIKTPQQKQTTTLSAPGAVAPYPSSTIAIEDSTLIPINESIVSKDGILYEYPISPQNSYACQARIFRINGYANAGVFCNTHGYRNNGLSNCQSDSVGALNGLYLSIGKDLCTDCQDFDWGYDVDFMFGYDARYLQTYSGLDQSWVTGHTTRGQRGYGFAMPQVYAELGYKDFRLKAGHFYTLLGYEQSRADERFFYSQGLAYQALPITHTGVLLSYEGLEHWTGTIGWVNGVDTGFNNEDGESLVIGELKYKPWNWLRAKYAFIAGNLSVTELNPFDVLWQDNRLNAHFPQGGRSGQGATHSFVTEIDLGRRWTYVFEFDYNDSQNDILYTVLPEGGGALRNGWGNWKTFSQDLFYTWNDAWKWGVRVEWWKANMTTHRYDNNTNWTGRGKLTSVTVAANWTPGQKKRLVVRPEIRYDHASEPLFAGETKRDQLYLGGDVMFKY